MIMFFSSFFGKHPCQSLVLKGAMDREGLFRGVCVSVFAHVCDYPQFTHLHDDPKYNFYVSLEYLTERARALQIRTINHWKKLSWVYFPDPES